MTTLTATPPQHSWTWLLTVCALTVGPLLLAAVAKARAGR